MAEVIRNNLRRIRHQLEIDTQTEMAKMLRISLSQYCRYENQEMQPTFIRALKIAEILKMPVEKIFYISRK